MKVLNSVGSCLFTLSTVLLFGTTVTPSAQAQTYQGCPSGYVCIYPENAGFNNGEPSNKYYRYGAYKLYNQYGHHYVFNNQTGGARVLLCEASTGTDCPETMPARTAIDYNLTPINSIRLIK